ncbi:hypothetical protein L596_026005 [Steinernema carpocapsae]|uniref:Uncharacterized protein n=1 Tax=Steinernema carpocapsae TaxID=34508 RepID=A0A4U5M019_STECR|nr:hypothetical protein L596_026005 [Steinernema carpocapsae]
MYPNSSFPRSPPRKILKIKRSNPPDPLGMVENDANAHIRCSRPLLSRSINRRCRRDVWKMLTKASFCILKIASTVRFCRFAQADSSVFMASLTLESRLEWLSNPPYRAAPL